MTLTVAGIDMIPYIAYGGLQWQRADVDGEAAGRTTLSGTTIRDRIAIKIRWDITCRPLKADELSLILSAIEPEFVTVTYTDPVTNTTKSDKFYSNNFPATFAMKDRAGREWWSGLTFPLIQR